MLYVQDLGSTNGMLHNGVKVAQATLEHGDVVTFGGGVSTKVSERPGPKAKHSIYTYSFEQPNNEREEEAQGTKSETGQAVEQLAQAAAGEPKKSRVQREENKSEKQGVQKVEITMCGKVEGGLEGEKEESGRRRSADKRKVDPYIAFAKEMRPKIVKENPNMAFGNIGKALAAAWKKLTDAQKEKYTRGREEETDGKGIVSKRDGARGGEKELDPSWSKEYLKMYGGEGSSSGEIERKKKEEEGRGRKRKGLCAEEEEEGQKKKVRGNKGGGGGDKSKKEKKQEVQAEEGAGLLGKRVKIYWEGEGCWFAGVTSQESACL